VTRLGALTLAAVLAAAHGGSAQETLSLDFESERSPIEIRADRLTAEQGGALIRAAGRVTITWKGFRLTADEVSYAPETNVADARGEVTLEDEDGNTLRCRRLTIDIDTQTGQIEEGTIWIAQEGYRVWAERIWKIGPSTFRGENGGFTACDGTWPSWRVSADKIEVELDETLVGRGAAFWVEGLPIAYSPRVLFPMRRQSGFLTPKVGYTDRDGAFWAARYYWAFADNADLTAELQYRSRRGWTEGLEFRYVLAEEHEGSTEVTHLWDRRDASHRYTVKADHWSRFDAGSRVRLHVDFRSDADYQKDLGETLDERGVEFLESYLLGTHDIQQGTLFGFFDYYQSLEGGQDATLQTLPSLGLFARETPLAGPVLWSPAVRATEFYRQEGVDGERLELNPGFALDERRGGVGLAARTGYRQNLYHVDQETTSRGAAWAEATAELSLVREYGPLVHTVEPSLSLFWEEDGRGGDPPQLDPSDEFSNVTRLKLLLESRLLRREDFAPVAGFDLETPYRLDDWDWEPFRAETFWRPNRFFELRADGVVDPNRSDPWLRWSAGAEGRDRRGDWAFAEYRYLRGRAGYLDGGVELALTRMFSLQYRHRYSARDDETLEQGFGVRVAHPCWELLLNLSRNLRDDGNDYENRFFASINLKGLAKFGDDEGILP
jgi:LPS-assembly protein